MFEGFIAIIVLCLALFKFSLLGLSHGLPLRTINLLYFRHQDDPEVGRSRFTRGMLVVSKCKEICFISEDQGERRNGDRTVKEHLDMLSGQ